MAGNNGGRRSSVFGGLLLILLGVIFLLDRFHPELGVAHLIRLYWPLLLILWGVARLIDYAAARRADQSRPPLLSGGEAALVILLAVILSAFVFRDWIRQRYPDLQIEIPPFQQTFSQSEDLTPRPIPAGARVTIETARGDLSIQGEDGSELRVNVQKSVPAASQSEADERLKDVRVVIEQAGDEYRIYPLGQKGFSGLANIGLEVHLPKAANVSAHTASGDITAAGVDGRLDVRSDHGNVEIRDAGSDVVAALQRGDARIRGVGGNMRLSGRGEDVEVADVSGDATIDGAFLGSLRMRHVAKTIRCASSRSDLTIAHLTGRLELDASDLVLSDVSGPARISTQDKDVEIERVAGKLDVADVHGDIKVTFAVPPGEDTNVTDDSGSVDVTLPANSSFEVSAVSRSGNVESDFGAPSLVSEEQADIERFHGTVGQRPGAPQLTIATSYGTIRLHKLR